MVSEGWRDAALLGAVGRAHTRNGCDRQRVKGYRGGRFEGPCDARVTDLEMDKREVSGLPKHARERAWKGGLR